jgi:hypothetical protein
MAAGIAKIEHRRGTPSGPVTAPGMPVKKGDCRGGAFEQVRAARREHPNITQPVVIGILIAERVAQHAQKGNLLTAMILTVVEPSVDREKLRAARHRLALDTEVRRSSEGTTREKQPEKRAEASARREILHRYHVFAVPSPK